MGKTTVEIQRDFFKYEFKTLREFLASTFILFILFSTFVGLFDGAAFVLTPILFFSIFNFFFFRVIYKILDRENYDEAVDKFLIGLLWVWVPANYVLTSSPLFFTLLALLLFLKSQSFYLGQSYKFNPFLRILLNSNISFTASLYFISTFLIEQGLELWDDRLILLTFAIWLSDLAYSFSKSMRGEDIDLKLDYLSSQFGSIKSSILILCTLFIQLFTLIYLSKSLYYQMHIILGLVVLFVLHYFVYHFYIIKGTERLARQLAPSTLGYTLMSLFLLFLSSLLEWLF